MNIPFATELIRPMGFF